MWEKDDDIKDAAPLTQWVRVTNKGELGPDVRRLDVPGGWIYYVGNEKIIFVPHPIVRHYDIDNNVIGHECRVSPGEDE